MKVNSPIFNNKILFLFFGLILLLVITGCDTTPPPVPPEPTISIGISIDTPGPSNVTSDTLLVKYRIDCSCQDNNIKAVLSVTPMNGVPPYNIPGFEFVEALSFRGTLGDVYSITIKSSDDPPFTWRGDIKLECSTLPACSTTAIEIPPTPTIGTGNEGKCHKKNCNKKNDE